MKPIDRRQGAGPVLAVHGLSKSYRDGRKEHAVLAAVELSFARSECLALLGRSG